LDEGFNVPSSHILAVNVSEYHGCILVTMKEPSEPPYLIDNGLDCDVIINQTEVYTYWKIPKSSKVAYAWDSLSGIQKLNIQLLDCIPKELNINEVTQKPIVWQLQNPKDRSQGRTLKILVKAKGPTRLIQIRDTKTADNEDRDEKENENFKLFVDTKLSGIGISLIDNVPKEVCYIFIGDIRFRYATSESNMYVEFKCLNVQVDNMLRDAVFPVVMAPFHKHTYDVTEKVALPKPFLHFSVCVDDSLSLVRYFSINLQEMRVSIEFNFIINILNAVGELTSGNDNERVENSLGVVFDPDILAINDMLKIVSEQNSENNQKFYFEILELHPIKINFSFKFTESENETSVFKEDSLENTFYQMLKSIGFLTNIDDAPICLNALILHHPLLTIDSLKDRIQKHYIRCVTPELYKIVGSLELIGNPVGLFNDLTTGVKDLFYEPANALTRSPEDFSRGLAKGSLSLLSHSIHGTFNTASKITNTIGKGVSMLTLDDNYVKRRERNAARKARGVKEGLIDGTEALAKGFYEGATGVFTQPLKGGKSEGFLGVVKGIGKGIIGIPTKPISGLVDFAAKTTEGISNIGTVHVDRRRKPRTFRDDGLLTLYNEQDAFAAELLYEVNEGSYMRKSNQITLLTSAEPERPLYYMPSKDESNIYLITTRNILCVKLSNKSIQWIINPKQIKSVTSGQHDEIVISYTEGSNNAEKKLNYKDPKYLKRFKELLLSIQFKTKKNSRN
jgi:hypothetical protein